MRTVLCAMLAITFSTRLQSISHFGDQHGDA